MSLRHFAFGSALALIIALPTAIGARAQDVESAAPTPPIISPAIDKAALMAGVASHRFDVEFKGPDDDHSYQVPIDGLSRATAKIAAIQMPKSPKTTLMVGVIGGGTSVNAISLPIEIRSEAMAPLLAAEKQVMAAIDEAVAEANKSWGVTSLSAKVTLVGVQGVSEPLLEKRPPRAD